MKSTNIGSYSTAIANGMHQVDEFEDDINIVTKVYAITRNEWVLEYGYKVGKISMKEQTVSFDRATD